jgi:redox-sensitive bicupin YhaK (pirin superfamily)
MNYIRKADERGLTKLDWLTSWHSFSFGGYRAPEHQGLSVLRVMNDDVIKPGGGFATHSHQDMEIISYILHGSIEHQDSMGHHELIPAGDIQVMSAGSGVAHSEFNPSTTERLHLLQIWILPQVKGIAPSYQQRQVIQDSALTLLVSPDGREGSLSIHQDACLYRLKLKANQTFQLSAPGRQGYLHVMARQVVIDGHDYLPGDAIGHTEALHLQARSQGLEALWFDLPRC